MGKRKDYGASYVGRWMLLELALESGNVPGSAVTSFPCPFATPLFSSRTGERKMELAGLKLETSTHPAMTISLLDK